MTEDYLYQLFLHPPDVTEELTYQHAMSNMLFYDSPRRYDPALDKTWLILSTTGRVPILSSAGTYNTHGKGKKEDSEDPGLSSVIRLCS